VTPVRYELKKGPYPLSPKVVTVAGISIENLFVLFWKDVPPIVFTPLGITANPLQAEFEITVLFRSMVKYPEIPHDGVKVA
jgi:hypothetical protein